ncbi:MAG: hypothetical protein ACRDQA_31240 [Nocardioidaceae bacterium]
MSRTDSAARVIEADVERTFAALIDPEALVAWLPPTGMTGRFEEFEAPRIRAENVPKGISAEDHAAGFASSLCNLARLLER